MASLFLGRLSRLWLKSSPQSLLNARTLTTRHVMADKGLIVPAQAQSIAGRLCGESSLLSQQGSNLFSSVLRSDWLIGVGSQFVRGAIRKHYKPNARKRIKKHGFEKRTSTVKGLQTLWRRFLKGRHSLST